MFEFLLIFVTATMGGAEPGPAGADQGAGQTEMAASAASGSSSQATSLAPAQTTDTAEAQRQTYTAESQVPTGKFTTATEVKPILDATRANWIAIREYDGKDLLYLSHLLSWRCGLVAIHVSINDGPLELWPMEACHTDSRSPNALIDDPLSIYKSYALNSLETVSVEITYDDLTADAATFDRNGAMIP